MSDVPFRKFYPSSFLYGRLDTLHPIDLLRENAPTIQATALHMYIPTTVFLYTVNILTVVSSLLHHQCFLIFDLKAVPFCKNGRICCFLLFVYRRHRCLQHRHTVLYSRSIGRRYRVHSQSPFHFRKSDEVLLNGLLLYYFTFFHRASL